MRRNPNLELTLLPPSVSLNSDNHHRPPMLELLNGSPSTEKDMNNQKLVIFYNGMVSVCDATEIQARAIILLANQETEKSKSPSVNSEPSSPLLYSPTTGLAMKKSLQQFLQKRKNRIQATSPYNR